MDHCTLQDKVAPVYCIINSVLCYGDVWRSGGVTSCIHILRCRWKWAICFNPQVTVSTGKESHVFHWVEGWLGPRIDLVNRNLGVEVIMAVDMQITIFRDVTPCSLVDMYGRFTRASCLHHHLMWCWGTVKFLWSVINIERLQSVTSQKKILSEKSDSLACSQVVTVTEPRPFLYDACSISSETCVRKWEGHWGRDDNTVQCSIIIRLPTDTPQLKKSVYS